VSERDGFLLEARGVQQQLGGREVLRGVDLRLRRGEMLGLIGPNGAGKSTLLRAITGLLEPQRGEILFDGRPLASFDDRARARRIAYLAQGGEAHWPLPVERLVAIGRLPHLSGWQQPGAADAAAVEAALRATDAWQFRTRSVSSLSGGERMRVMLARALAGGPELLLADEPVAALDPAHQIGVMSLLKAQAEAGGAVVAVLHDLTLAARYCDRLVLLAEGCVAAEGAPREVLSEETLARVYGVHACIGHSEEGALYVLPWRMVER
jgi:iron complex transport system ATP-binding protein